jgi:hypothetical protein
LMVILCVWCDVCVRCKWIHYFLHANAKKFDVYIMFLQSMQRLYSHHSVFLSITSADFFPSLLGVHPVDKLHRSLRR